MSADLQAAGFHLAQLPSPRSPFSYLASYRKLLRQAGPFDVVHSHLNFAGLLMYGAACENVAVRIAQSHVSAGLMTNGALAGGYVRLTNRLLLRHMTHGFAVSPDAADSLFGRRWQNNPKVSLNPCGIDLEAYRQAVPAGRRESLGLPGGVPLLGVIGRLSAEKNQAFALHLLHALRESHPHMHLLLIGSGEQESELVAQARALGIADAVHFLGERRDVPELLRGVIDLLLLPSLTEGSPLTVIESQAAGVPCVVSPAIPDASIINEQLVHRCSLDIAAWVQQIEQLLVSPPRAAALPQLHDSPFDLGHNAALLDTIYSSAR